VLTDAQHFELEDVAVFATMASFEAVQLCAFAPLLAAQVRFQRLNEHGHFQNGSNDAAAQLIGLVLEQFCGVRLSAFREGLAHGRLELNQLI
jgi:hypothetical protein